jgi:DNA modification methylase
MTASFNRKVRKSSKPADAVLDLLPASGSTLIACERTGRTCYGIARDPYHLDLVIACWEVFTGEKAMIQ